MYNEHCRLMSFVFRNTLCYLEMPFLLCTSFHCVINHQMLLCQSIKMTLQTHIITIVHTNRGMEFQICTSKWTFDVSIKGAPFSIPSMIHHDTTLCFELGFKAHSSWYLYDKKIRCFFSQRRTVKEATMS